MLFLGLMVKRKPKWLMESLRKKTQRNHVKKSLNCICKICHDLCLDYAAEKVIYVDFDVVLPCKHVMEFFNDLKYHEHQKNCSICRTITISQFPKHKPIIKDVEALKEFHDKYICPKISFLSLSSNPISIFTNESKNDFSQDFYQKISCLSLTSNPTYIDTPFTPEAKNFESEDLSQLRNQESEMVKSIVNTNVLAIEGVDQHGVYLRTNRNDECYWFWSEHNIPHFEKRIILPGLRCIDIGHLRFHINQRVFDVYWNLIYIHIKQQLNFLKNTDCNCPLLLDCWNIMLSYCDVSIEMMIDTMLHQLVTEKFKSYYGTTLPVFDRFRVCETIISRYVFTFAS